MSGTTWAPLSIWVIYDKPEDYPNDVVARRWDWTLKRGSMPVASQDLLSFATMDDARAAMKARRLEQLPQCFIKQGMADEAWWE